MPRDSADIPGWVQAFLATQHVPAGSRLSSWLRSESARDRAAAGWSAQTQPEMLEKRPAPLPTARHHHEHYSPGLRPFSPPSMVDPLQSPINFSRPITLDPFDQYHLQEASYLHPAFDTPVPLQEAAPKKKSKDDQRRKTSKQDLKAPQPTFFHSKDPKIRYKSVGTLISGALLIIILTTYLALATSNTIPTVAFHGGFIFVIIVLTMIFAHFLIRLCMLSFGPRKPCYVTQQPPRNRHHHHHPGGRRRYHRHHHHHHNRQPRPDLEAGPPSSTQVPRLASSEDVEGQRSRSRESAGTDKDLPPPPPAYGWWRGSVRVDPDDIRYQNPDRSDLQQETRSLVFAGSGHRPPSYTSDPLDLEREVARPTPLFGRGRGMRRGNGFRNV